LASAQFDQQQSVSATLPSSQASPGSSCPLPHRRAFSPPLPATDEQVNSPVNRVPSGRTVPLTDSIGHGPADPLAVKLPAAGSIVPARLTGGATPWHGPVIERLV
jgi:hypothetical protein